MQTTESVLEGTIGSHQWRARLLDCPIAAPLVSSLQPKQSKTTTDHSVAWMQARQMRDGHTSEKQYFMTYGLHSFFETRFKYIKRRASLLARFTERTFLDPSGRRWHLFVVPRAIHIHEEQGGPPIRWPPACKRGGKNKIWQLRQNYAPQRLFCKCCWRKFKLGTQSRRTPCSITKNPTAVMMSMFLL